MALDIQGLADMKCHVCGGMGHLARNCPTPSNPKGGGKGGKSGGKGGKASGKGGKATGKGVRNAHLLCTTCNKVGHLKDRCWVTFPDLQRKKKPVQGVEDVSLPMDSICIGAVDTCDSSTAWTYVKKSGFAQTTVVNNIATGNLSVTGSNVATGGLSVTGPRLTNGNLLDTFTVVPSPAGPRSLP